MSASTSTTIRRADRIPLAVLALAILFAGGSQIIGSIAAGGPPEPLAADVGVSLGEAPVDVEVPAGAPPATSDLERIRANVAFWSERARANPRDFVSSTRWAASEIDLARATSDVTRYVAADEALDAALAANPDYRLAQGYRGAVLVALHQFADARTAARAVLADYPTDPAALATLGDAALALGDMDEARGAYQQLSLVADSAAARVRRSHLAFVDGDPDAAVEASRSAVTAAVEEELEGTELAWYRYQLGDTLASTGDLEGARASFAEALRDDANSPLAHWGLARVAAAAEDWDTAISHLDAAIAVIPSPEYVARRADIYRLRGAPGDDRREREDRRTVLAIGQLAGEAAGVYDRTLSLYLSSSGEDPARALRLAETELVARKDIYGYDALAWALLANGRADEARAQMAEALALGTRDAKLLYHAGMIEAALGNDACGSALPRGRAHDRPELRSARRSFGPHHTGGAALMRASGRALALALLSILVLPAVVLAHPLGNFTINHYAGLRIEPDSVTLDLVIDQAEIPAFQARQALDANEDGEVSDAELEAGRVPSCDALTDDLHLAIEGSSMKPKLTAAGVELRPGVGGLSTLRLVCVFEADLSAPVASGAQVEFADTSFAGRLGWREIVVEGSGVAVAPVEGELRDSSISDRLQAYPADRLDNALADERVVVAVTPGGAELPPVAVSDATLGRGRAWDPRFGPGAAVRGSCSGRRGRRDPGPLPDP